MYAVWGKIDPNKRISTFEVSFKLVYSLGFWSWLYDQRRVQSLLDWMEHQSLPRTMFAPIGSVDSKYARECVQNRGGPTVPTARRVQSKKISGARFVSRNQIRPRVWWENWRARIASFICRKIESDRGARRGWDLRRIRHSWWGVTDEFRLIKES